MRYVTTEIFMNEFVEAIRTNSRPDFKRRYREVDLLLVDDVQFVQNHERLQEEFFHTFDSLHGSGSQLVLSSDRPPKDMATLEDRLRTRFEWGLLTDIQPPEYEPGWPSSATRPGTRASPTRPTRSCRSSPPTSPTTSGSWRAP